MPNTSLTLWQQILQDPKSLIALAALIANIIVTTISLWLNNIWFVKRRHNERNYNVESNFYKICVLDKMSMLSTFPCEIRIRFSELVTDCHKCIEAKGDVLLTVQKAQEWLDSKYREIGITYMPHVRGYSKSLQESLSTIVESYYDTITLVFSKMNKQELTHDFERTIGNHLVGESNKYIELLFDCIKSHGPKKE